MIDSPFLRKDPAYWPLVGIAGISTVGIGLLGVGFALASSVLSAGQITEVQRPDRTAIVPWPIIAPPPAVTVTAAAIALIAIVILTTRSTVRHRGTLSTTFGWSLSGGIGSWALAISFPDASIGASPLLVGYSDHALGAVGFALAALASLIGQGRSSRATRAVRAAGLNPAFLPITPPQGTSPVPDLVIEAPPMWRWTTEYGAPAIVPEEGRPAPMRIVVLDGAVVPAADPAPMTATVNGTPTRREIIADGSEGTILRYRFSTTDGAADRVIEARITTTADPHERTAYRDCADLIAGSVRWRR